jgi:hypothetical protein
MASLLATHSMPNSPARLCRDCSSRALPTTSYCARHTTTNNHTANRLLYDRYRSDDPVRQLYRGKNLRRWEATRRVVFKRDILCQWPAGCPHAATECDHIRSARSIVLEFGTDAFYDPARCQGLCKEHHSEKTRHELGSRALRAGAGVGETGQP